MEDEDEELRLLKEALWYGRWSIVFGVMVVVIQVVGIIEAIKGRFGTFLTLLVLALAVWLFSRYLYMRARQYRHKADEVSDD